MRSDAIYLDYNATTPLDPKVAEAMLPYLRTGFGNPSSGHVFGIEARRAVEAAREHVAALLGAEPGEIVFTGGGTESNNAVIKGVGTDRAIAARHIVTSAIEHPAVLEPIEALERDGLHATIVPCDDKGRVDPAAIGEALRPETVLVTVMHANNEVGALQDIPAIAARAHERGVLVHTDAAQSVGKVPVDVNTLGVDLLTIAAHKLYAPKGVGALFVRRGTALAKFLHGAGHERNRRAGTENVLGIVGLGRAAEIARERQERDAWSARALRERLFRKLGEHGLDLVRHGDPEATLPNTLSVAFRGVRAPLLLEEIGDRVAASLGAACHADGVSMSTVLRAMGVPLAVALGTMRFSVGRFTTEDEIDRAAAIVGEAVRAGRCRLEGEVRDASS